MYTQSHAHIDAYFFSGWMQTTKLLDTTQICPVSNWEHASQISSVHTLSNSIAFMYLECCLRRDGKRSFVSLCTI